MRNQTEVFRRFEFGKGTEQVNFSFNRPFSVNPRFVEHKARESLIGITPNQEIEVPLMGEDESRGFLRIKAINRNISLGSGHTVLLPLGEPTIKHKIDPQTGELIPTDLPISLSLGFGPVTGEQIKSGQARILMTLPNIPNRFIALPHDYFFEPTGRQRMIISQGWIDMRTGERGELLLPSGADFDRISFTFVKE